MLGRAGSEDAFDLNRMKVSSKQIRLTLEQQGG